MLRVKSLLCLTSVLIASLFSSVAGAQVQLTVDGSSPGPRLSPLLYGIFFEEINHAGDGGLYAEKLRDRLFAETTRYWRPQGQGVTFSDGFLNLAPSAPVETEGYWGIGVAQHQALRLTAQIDGGSVRADLLTPDGTLLVTGILSKAAPSLLLTPKSACPTAHLRLTAQGQSVRLSHPSLMPIERYGKAPIRRDLGTLIAGLRPSFLRFPGGCYVEGERLADRFEWKRSLGSPFQRSGTRCLWGYQGTNGLGYHEFLQWAEDIKAEPLFVINCGMSHRDNTPLPQMGTVVQDALDAIEYATGDAKRTRWGAARAKNGHSKPFALNYIEIGNENGGPEYDRRYKILYQAIKRRYPKIHLIANVWGGAPRSAPLEILDEHYYDTPEFFQNAAFRYDSYDRKGPKVYVGEYAVTKGSGTGNLIAALGEAAFMTGMERNADIVAMASYAPLLVNANDRRWNPDLIVFDSSRAYGTPSYWTQQLFSSNRGDTVLPTTIHDPAAPASPLSSYRGIGVSTWRTDATFKEIRINDTPATVQPVTGNWKTSEGGWRQSDNGEDRRATSQAATDDYTLTLKARKNAGSEGFLILVRSKDARDFLWWNLGGWNNTRHGIELSTGGAKQELASQPGSIAPNRWYSIKVICKGRTIRCFLDGKVIHSVVLPPAVTDLTAVSTWDEKAGEVLVKVVNLRGRAVPTTLHFQHLPSLTGQGTATTLTSAKPTDENSFATPNRVAPRSLPLSRLSDRSSYTFPPYSLTVLRLKTNRSSQFRR